MTLVLGVVGGSLLRSVPRIQDEGWRGAVPTFVLIGCFEPKEPWDSSLDWRDSWGELLADRAEYDYENWWAWERQWYFGRMIQECEERAEPLVSDPVVASESGRVFGMLKVPERMWPVTDVRAVLNGQLQRFSLDRNRSFVVADDHASPDQRTVKVEVEITAGETVLWSGQRTVGVIRSAVVEKLLNPVDYVETRRWLQDQFWVSKDSMYIAVPWEDANSRRVYIAAKLEFLRNGVPVADAYYNFARGKLTPLSPIREAGLQACMRWFGYEPFTEVPEDGAAWTWRLTGDPAFAAACVASESLADVECWRGSLEGPFQSFDN